MKPQYASCKTYSSLFLLASSLVIGCPCCVHAVVDRPVSKPKRKYHWVVDSGATIHCVNDFSLLTTVYTDTTPIRIKVANKQTTRAHAVGSAVVNMTDEHGKTHQVTLHNVV